MRIEIAVVAAAILLVACGSSQSMEEAEFASPPAPKLALLLE